MMALADGRLLILTAIRAAATDCLQSKSSVDNCRMPRGKMRELKFAHSVTLIIAKRNFERIRNAFAGYTVQWS